MKKLLAILTISLLILSGCMNSNSIKDMTITLSPLTLEEQKMANLVVGNSSAYFFDYKVNEIVKAYRIDLYRLSSDGTWKYEEGGYSNSIQDNNKKGRIMLQRHTMTKALTIASQSELDYDRYDSDNKNYGDGAYNATPIQVPHDIILGKESPLLIEVFALDQILEPVITDDYYNTEQLLSKVDKDAIVLATVIVFEDSIK